GRGWPFLGPRTCSRSSRDLEIENRVLERHHEAHPEGKNHLQAARRCQVSQVNGVLPAEGAQDLDDLRFGLWVVPADEYVVLAPNQAGVHHDRVAGRVERLYDLNFREAALDLLRERVGVA